MGQTPYLLLQDDVQWVFGLSWAPCIRGNPRHRAHRRARRQGASHVVVSPVAHASFGYGRLPGAESTAVYAGAQCFANWQAQGTVAWLCELPPAGWWLVAAHEGSVIMGTDVLFAGYDSAVQQLQVLQKAYPALTVLVLNPAPTSPVAVLAEHLGEHSRLQRVRRSGHVLVGLVSLTLVGAGIVHLTSWEETEASPEDSQSVLVHQAQAWDQAVQQSLSAIRLHGATGLQRVLGSLQALPWSPEGWRFKAADCQPSGRDAWHCHAQYEPTETAGSHTDLHALLQTWGEVDFPALQQARLQWSIAVPAPVLSLALMQSTAYNQQVLYGALQDIKPLLAQLSMREAIALPVVAPQTSDARPIERPAHLPQVQKRAFSLHLPLRSSTALLPHVAAFSWRGIGLQHQAGAAASLQISQLMLTLEGDLYETAVHP